MSITKKIIAIVGGAVVGGLGIAALVFPENAVVFGSVSGAIGILIGGLTGISLLKGE